MRDAQSKLDQVIAFTGSTIAADDVATVLGLVGRDLLLDTLQAVADEDAPAAFALAARAVELGYDLRAVCRELARAVRDLLVLAVDPSRINDPEIAAESERDRLKSLAARYSREDLLRAFDLLTTAEENIRTASQPRYHLEMLLLRWIYLRKLTPIEDLIAGSGSAERTTLRAQPAVPAAPKAMAPVAPKSAESAPQPKPVPATPAAGSPKDAFLAEIRKTKVVFYNTVVAQAQKIEVGGDAITFSFLPNQALLRNEADKNRAWLESIAQQATGRRFSVVATIIERSSPAAAIPPAEPATKEDKKSALRQKALADAGVQALFEVFPAEIRDVEEM